MLTRRDILAGAATAPMIGAAAAAQDLCAAYTTASRETVSPQDAVRLLREGNARFVAGAMTNCDLRAQVSATAEGQYPFAAIVGCIDSRVPPEMVFDQEIGSLFVARVAGNFVNTDILGSLEFACAAAGARAIVVLGHTSCGAIKGAVDKVELGNLTAMLANLEPAVAAVKHDGARTSKDYKLVQKVADANVALTVAAITERSPVLAALVAEGKLVVVGAMHDIHTGEVSFL